MSFAIIQISRFADGGPLCAFPIGSVDACHALPWPRARVHLVHSGSWRNRGGSANKSIQFCYDFGENTQRSAERRETFNFRTFTHFCGVSMDGSRSSAHRPQAAGAQTQGTPGRGVVANIRAGGPSSAIGAQTYCAVTPRITACPATGTGSTPSTTRSTDFDI